MQENFRGENGPNAGHWDDHYYSTTQGIIKLINPIDLV